MIRVGFGQDSHRFSADPGRKLMLGGVHVPGEAGLEGNSDGDVILHALCRALEQAIGRGSFSRYADQMSRNGINDSLEYVRVASSHVDEAGYRVNNVGLSVEGRRPKIEPLAEAISGVVAGLLGIATDAVGVNATTGEDLTPFGKGEGIQAFAIVSLESVHPLPRRGRLRSDALADPGERARHPWIADRPADDAHEHGRLPRSDRRIPSFDTLLMNPGRSRESDA